MFAPLDGETDLDACVAEYHTSRARHIRTITAGAEKRIQDTIGKRREPLIEEVSNLRLLSQSRSDTYQAALSVYKAKAPSRVRGTAVLPPSPAERFIPGIDKVYKATVKAGEEYAEISAIIKKRAARLDELNERMRVQMEQYGRDLIARLETPDGLQAAFQRDPLLSRAHARMIAAQTRRNNVLETT